MARGRAESWLIAALLAVCPPLGQAENGPEDGTERGIGNGPEGEIGNGPEEGLRTSEGAGEEIWDEDAGGDPRAWSASVQAGLVLTTGNARTTALSGMVALARTSSRQQLRLQAGGTYARSSFLLARDLDASGTIDGWNEITRQSRATHQSWRVHTRYDRSLTRQGTLYLAGLASGDTPAGKAFEGGGQAGYGRTLLDGGTHELAAELGYDLRYQALVAGPGVAIHSVHGQLAYAVALGPATRVSASVEGLFNTNALALPAARIGPFQDIRIHGSLGLITKLHEDVRFGFEFHAHFDNAPLPLPPLNVPFGAGFHPLTSRLETRSEAKLIVDLL